MAKRRSGRMPSMRQSAPVKFSSLFGSVKHNSQSLFSFGKGKVSPFYKKTSKLARRRPFVSFFAVLGILLLTIIAGNVLSSFSKKSEKPVEIVKNIETYNVGESPKVALQAQVDQEGTIEIVAQMPGIVSEVLVSEGDHVYKGNTLVSMSSNYQGGSAPGLQAQLAGTQYKNIKDTYDTQKDIILKQREITEKTNENAEELRKISDATRSDTGSLLSLNETILTALSNNVTALQQSGAPADQILAAQSQQAQAQAGVNQLRAAQRNLDYQTNTDRPPTELANLQKDISLKQLDVQEKALSLSLEASRIQYNLALVQAGMMRPASPFNGTVERVLVSPGQSVNPGTVLAIVSSDNPKATLTAFVPYDVAINISRAEPSTLYVGGKKVKLVPSYVSTVATQKLLYTVLFTVPDEYIKYLANNSFIAIDAPITTTATTNADPYIPIDSVFQSQNASFVFIVKNGKAQSKQVTLGPVYGSFVSVVKGITNGDKIILSRNVVTGEKVKIAN